MMSLDQFKLILKHLEDNNDRWNVLTMRSDLERAVREIIRLKSIINDSEVNKNVIQLPEGFTDTLDDCSEK